MVFASHILYDFNMWHWLIAIVTIFLITHEPKLKNQIALYQQLIESVGPVQAQEYLKKSGLPFDGQSHLLNHEVGDWLYDRYGAEGLKYCKDYFLSSCYHGFIITAISRGGISKLDEVIQHCRKQGPTVAIQCKHAMGHGFLAWTGYKNLPNALDLCGLDYNCQDGVFMENLWAVHDNGQPSPDRWLNDADPMYPCNAVEVKDKYRQACWSNQPARLYQLWRGDVTAVGKICEQITVPSWQQTCFDGLARQIHPETHGDINKVFSMCEQMPQAWVNRCLVSIVKSAYSVGDRKSPKDICQRLNTNECWMGLEEITKAYAK